MATAHACWGGPLGFTFKNKWKVGIPSKIKRKLFTTNAYQGRAKTLMMKQNTCWQLTCERFAHLAALFAALFAMHSYFCIFLGHGLTSKMYEDKPAVALEKKWKS
jgi:hypothetical protein